MDSFDLTIIRQLMRQARSTWAELASLTGLSAPAVAERVRKLEDSGSITGYAALIAPAAIGCDLAAIIAVYLDQPGERAAFLQMVQKLPAIQECHHVAGDADYLLKVRCANTRALEQLISEQLKSIPGLKTKTTIILSTEKETPCLPLTGPKEE